ncbi:MAG: tRNA 4-thiouridine(8) synthase ThiI [Oscillospiraceae bacterium]|nr:tRNA 4-thiouridine(8) synthase ThiI [Oscillospiraceae bacterium]
MAQIAREIIMCKYGEIALKGHNKRTFEEILVKNIKKAIADIGEFRIERMQSTVYIAPVEQSTDLDAVVAVLCKVFGLGAVQKCGVFPKDFAAISTDGVAYLENALKDAKSFKVEAKRADKAFPLTTPDIQRELGGKVLDAYPHLSVDVHNPEVTVLLEIRDKAAYMNAQRLTAAGGLPVGSSGRGLLLLSGGLDSPVAAHMIAKRGVLLDAVHFMSPPYTSERALLKVETLCKKLKPYLVHLRLHTIEFTEVQEAIRDNCPEEYGTLVLRRLMIRAANKLAAANAATSRKPYGAFVTGESLGQVASQTLAAIGCTDEAAELPILRPLIGMDKIEIVAIARAIDTYDTSTLPYEDCCTIFTPKHPKTNPKLAELFGVEARLDYDELVTNAVKTMTIQDF